MDYLKDYNISDDELDNIRRVLGEAEVNIDMFLYNKEKIKSILDLFKNIGVTNFYGIIVTDPYMFYDTVKGIASKINGYRDKGELARLINEDPKNLDIIHLC